MLSHHVSSDEIVERANDHPHLSLMQQAGAGNASFHTNIHAGRYQTQGVVSTFVSNGKEPLQRSKANAHRSSSKGC